MELKLFWRFDHTEKCSKINFKCRIFRLITFESRCSRKNIQLFLDQGTYTHKNRHVNWRFLRGLKCQKSIFSAILKLSILQTTKINISHKPFRMKTDRLKTYFYIKISRTKIFLSRSNSRWFDHKIWSKIILISNDRAYFALYVCQISCKIIHWKLWFS